MKYFCQVLILLLITACGSGGSGYNPKIDNAESIDLNQYTEDYIYDSVSYENSDFWQMKTVGSGTLSISITPDGYQDIDCGLTSERGPSNFYQNSFIIDDNYNEISNDSYTNECVLFAEFDDDREFFLFVDLADSYTNEVSYTVQYVYTPKFEQFDLYEGTDGYTSGGQDNSDGKFIKVKTYAEGRLDLTITPNDYMSELNCSFMSQPVIGGDVLYDNNGGATVNNSFGYDSCNLSASFNSGDEFYILINGVSDLNSFYYTINYSYEPLPQSLGEWLLGDEGSIGGQLNGYSFNNYRISTNSSGRVYIEITSDYLDLEGLECALANTESNSYVDVLYDSRGIDIQNTSSNYTTHACTI